MRDALIGCATDIEVREPAAGQLLRMFEQLSHRAVELSGHIEGKLSPFTRPANPVNNKDKPADPWPPYFAELRDHYDRLRLALNEIESIVGRAEF